MQRFTGGALGSTDLGQVYIHHLLVMLSWAKCLNCLGISVLICKVEMFTLPLTFF